MKIFGELLCCVVIVHQLKNFVSGRLVIEKSDVWSNLEYCRLNFTSWVDPRTKSAAINTTFDELVQFDKEIIYVTLRAQKHKKDDSYSNEVFKTVIDVCRTMKGSMANFVVKMVMEVIEKAISWPLTCPFKKGVYHITNLVPIDLIPPHLKASKFAITAKMLAKIKTKKPLIHMYTLSIFAHSE